MSEPLDQWRKQTTYVGVADKQEVDNSHSGDAALLAQLRDENRELRREIERLLIYKGLAYRDHLTNLYNRRYFEERLTQELSRANRSGTPVALMMIDVDDFKRINDVAGHPMGDEVLRWVGLELASACRAFDVACRIGGDEFALIIPATNRAGVDAVTERIAERLRQAKTRPQLPPSVALEVSLGTAVYTEDAADAAGLVAQADRAMYRDKRRRKNSY